MAFKTKSLAAWVGGLVIAVLAPLAQAHIVNGSFEDFNESDLKPLNWTSVGNPESLFVGGLAPDGTHVARLGNGDSLSQLMTGIFANVAYELRFSYAADDDYQGTLTWMFGTTSGQLQQTTGASAIPFTFNDEFPFGSTSLLSFSVQGDEEAVFYVDNVVVFCIEEDERDCTPETGSVPEPGTLLLVGAALAGIGIARRRKI